VCERERDCSFCSFIPNTAARETLAFEQNQSFAIYTYFNFHHSERLHKIQKLMEKKKQFAGWFLANKTPFSSVPVYTDHRSRTKNKNCKSNHTYPKWKLLFLSDLQNHAAKKTVYDGIVQWSNTSFVTRD
jgi:hypothetical protein